MAEVKVDTLMLPEPAVPPIIAQIKNEELSARVRMERSVSQEIREERADLKEAAEHTSNIIVDVGLDGNVRWASPSWSNVVGTTVEEIQGKPIKNILLDDQEGDPFADAVASMKEDDSKSQIIHFRTKLGPNSLFKKSDLPEHAKDTGEPASPKSEAKEKEEEDDKDDTILLEGQGIMVYDRSTGQQSHTMWMLRPAVEPREITIDLPDVLVESLGFGAEVLATYLTALADIGAEDATHHPPPDPILCRICERQITPWWFEKHSDLCLQESKAESEVQQAQDALMEQRKAIEKVLDSLSMPRLPRSTEASPSPTPPVAEYKGLPITAPSANSSSSASGRASPATPPRSRETSVSGFSQARAKAFTVRRPVRHIVELLIDLCDTAIEIKAPALISDDEKNFDGEFRTQTPTSETRISQVLNFSTPSGNILETEQGLALLASDTENLAREKVEATMRHRRILEYSERIRIEFHVLVQDCIEAAIRKANNLREGRDSDESEEDEENEDDIETPAAGTSFVDETTEPESGQESSQQSSTDAAMAGLANLSLDDRRRSVAISTGSNSPMECPTPRSSYVSGLAGRSQSIGKRSSLYAASDAGDSDGSLSSSLVGGRNDSPSQDLHLSRSRSTRDPNKRRSLKLPAVSASPHRQTSPGRTPQSPLRLAKDRIPSGAYAASSPMSSPMISSMEPSSPADHRRQSSILSSSQHPPSPRLSAINQQPKPVPPSIKDFEIIKPISKGAFGSVYLSKKKATGDYYAIKVLKKSDMIAKNQTTNVKAERAIMMWQGESDFVAKLYWTFSSKDFLYLVMEYLNGGDCAALIKVLGGLPESWAKKYLAEVVSGVEHLHERGIVHRDLKPDNLLIDQKGHLKLTDFGLSRMGLIGRQKRHAKSPNESVPDLLKQGGPFNRPLSMTSSRSASFDFPSQNSPGATPLMTPDLEGLNGQPTYFNLGRDPIFGPHHSRRASGYRSDSGSSGTFGSMFKNLSLDEPTPRGPPIEEESFGEGIYSPDVFPLSLTTSHQQGGTPPQQSGISAPPPLALYDPDDQNRRFVGTPDYLAPETINGDGPEESADWWSCGCILFEFLFGYPPFHAHTPEKVFENILARNIEWPAEDDYNISSEARDLMDKLMTTDIKKRLGSNASEQFKSGGEEIRKHTWFGDINWDTIFEDEAQFVPAPENPEDTEYFDPRGATLQAFSEEFEEQSTSPSAAPNSSNDYQERPHDALSGLRRQVNQSIKRTLMPLHIPAHVRDSRSRRLSEPVANDDFGSFAFKNLPVLEKANKDVIQKLRAEAMKEQGKKNTGEPSSGANSPAPSTEGSPLLPSPLKRTLSTTQRGSKPPLPSSLAPVNASPHRLSQPTSPLLVQFSAGGNHERRKTSAGSSETHSRGSIASSVPALPSSLSMPASTPSPSKSNRSSDIGTMPMHSPNAIFGSTAARGAASRARSHTVGSQDNSGLSPKPFRDHKRRSQVLDVSPSSSDNEDPRAKALLRVQRRRQSSRRMSQFSLADGPCFRPLDVLICEDHPVSRMVMERLLEKIRCRTITAVTGPEAVRFATSEVQFDIIMMEIKLPQLNGSDVARMIRTTKNANQSTPIVAVTGYLKELPTTHNFDSLIEKPPTIDKLTEVLCNLCQWKAPPPDWHPGPQQHGPSSLRQEALLNEDSPSSQSSGPFGRNPGASYRASSREDSIGSSSMFGDMEPADAAHAGVIITGTGDEWGTNGLGITEDGVDPRSSSFHHPGLPHLIPFNSAPPVLDVTLPSPRKEPSSEAIKARKAAHASAKRTGEGGESGDDEDDELGGSVLAAPAPTGPTTPKSARHRARSSKLSTQMLRTNSRGSVISADEASPSSGDAVGMGLAETIAATGPPPTSAPVSRPSTSGSTTSDSTKTKRPQVTPLPPLSVSPPTTTQFPDLGDPPEVFPPESSGEQVKEIVDLDTTPRPSLNVLPPEAMLVDAASSSSATATPRPPPISVAASNATNTKAAIAAAAAAAASTSPTPGAKATAREQKVTPATAPSTALAARVRGTSAPRETTR